MEYMRQVILKDGRLCTVRHGEARDAEAVLANFILTHGQTDFLTTYPDEITLTREGEGDYLETMRKSGREAELVAEVDGVIAGTAGVSLIRDTDKTRHRASFGISVDRAWWGLGIGRALTDSCIECARRAGYAQLELCVVADNVRAMALYRSAGFVEYGRNPRGFRSRLGGWQENVLMRLELDT
ncbi:MAG: GNAT family N-acetyltransferase [Clostridia bacterium]|nr:GNAT family N-acetyltransferase [Clostridia bacterium]